MMLRRVTVDRQRSRGGHYRMVEVGSISVGQTAVPTVNETRNSPPTSVPREIANYGELTIANPREYRRRRTIW